MNIVACVQAIKMYTACQSAGIQHHQLVPRFFDTVYECCDFSNQHIKDFQRDEALLWQPITDIREKTKILKQCFIKTSKVLLVNLKPRPFLLEQSGTLELEINISITEKLVEILLLP